ncbi:tyrosine-type recombinase/integrase [Methanobacterium oryzae]|uniref:tyrosine-type recombinase/integrase n=1 Tax=Methanobacterium oryzae TaxID=69540 RepID=UPI003D1F0198
MHELDIEVVNDPYFINFIKKRKLSESTERVYNGRLSSFCKFLGKSPSELIKEAQKEKGQIIDEYFHDYIENLKKSGKSSNTIINRIDTLKAFYKEYNIGTDSINRIISPETENLTPKKIISEDQIKEALELSSLRDKAIILLHMSSGMEATELRHLTYGDFINSIEECIDLESKDKLNVNKIADKLSKMNEVVGTWKIEKNRTETSYVTFNTSESTKAILSYLVDRERKNKLIKSLKDPLFVNSQNQALNVSAHGSIFKRINNRANFGYLTKKRRFFSSTMLRKYFKYKLYESGIDKNEINAILGQKLDADIDYHSDAEMERLKNKYLLALGNLSLEKADIENVTSAEYKKLLKKLNEKDKELEEIKKHLDYIKSIIE